MFFCLCLTTPFIKKKLDGSIAPEGNANVGRRRAKVYILIYLYFVLNLGLMMDSLRELANVSESLQADGVTLQRAYQAGQSERWKQ